MSKWYVIKVMPGKERQLSEQFNTQITMGKIGFINRFVCPLEKEFVVIRKKKTLREKVIYNGYLYFESENSLTDDQLKTIAANPSIMGMLGDKTPRRMREDDIEKILKDESLEKHKENKSIRFISGENVVITEGPFSSFNGVIGSIKNDKVQLNVKVFGRDTSVEVNLDQISKVY
jgi:transcriptional antiterminator NusG